MKLLRSSWFPLLPALLMVVLSWQCTSPAKEEIPSTYNSYTNEWTPPNDKMIPGGEEGELIRYGEDLIKNTAIYLGPQGSVAKITNGMNCQNCHLDAGKQIFGNCLSAVAPTFPKYRDRSGKVESIEFRINDCLVRSLNGAAIDSLSKEMRAMVHYLKWLGKDVPKDVKPFGAGVQALPFLLRAADPEKGKTVFTQKCARCHGNGGEGLLGPDSSFFTYPPLWGPHSYNTAAGMYRLSSLANFVKANMPFGANYLSPQLTNEEAWDVAAFINSQPRPQKYFTKDWPDISKKPMDVPFGPFADSLPQMVHKYGPYTAVKK